MNEWLKILQSAWTELQKGAAWKVSRTVAGVQVAPPQLDRITLTLEPEGPEVGFVFRDGAISASLARGTVRRNGQPWANAKVRLSHRWRGLELRLVVEFIGNVAGTEERTRCDATVARIPLIKALRMRLAL